MTYRSWILPLLAALAVIPRPAQANPTALAALPTIAIATDPGVAEAMVPPAGTTRVTVEVASSPAEAQPASEPTPTVTAPRPEPEPYVPTLADRYAEQAHDDRKSGRGLVAGGLAVAGASYLFTSLAGALAIDRSRDLEDDPLTEIDESRNRDRRRSFGRALLIPGIGPAIAIHRSDSAIRAWGAGVAGLTQALGAGLAVLGVVRLARGRRLERLSVGASGDSRSAHVALRVRF